jgi:two-component system LytT family sensor kinase
LFTNVTLYVAVAGGATAYAYYSEARQRAVRQAALRAELTESRLRMLKAQIHPHFLFNTLHDISGLMATDRNAARAMMGRLEELLRIAVKDQADDLVPLAQELKFLQCYLDIEKMRLGERLTVHLEVDPATLSALVPSMMLQPLVENSVKHGIAKFSRRGWLRITVRREGDQLHLVVEDSGPGIRGASKTGVGLSNTEARLNHYYSSRQSIRYINLPTQGLRCEIVVPFSEAVPPLTDRVVVPEFAR